MLTAFASTKSNVTCRKPRAQRSNEKPLLSYFYKFSKTHHALNLEVTSKRRIVSSIPACPSFQKPHAMCIKFSIPLRPVESSAFHFKSRLRAAARVPQMIMEDLRLENSVTKRFHEKSASEPREAALDVF